MDKHFPDCYTHTVPIPMIGGKTRGAFYLALVSAAFLSGCAPKYAAYDSPAGDFRCLAPHGWEAVRDSDGPGYADTTFIGPFDPDFYLGAPSLSVRWYRDGYAHRLRDGSYERYAGASDFVAQTLRQVYGPDSQLVRPMDQVMVAGRRAEHFVLLSAGTPAPGAHWGLMKDARTGRLINPRKHAYVVLPLDSGFYVFIYPATDRGYARYLPDFNALVNSFTLDKDGAGGASAATPFPAAAAR